MQIIVGIIIFLIVFNAPGFFIVWLFPSMDRGNGAVSGLSFGFWIFLGISFCIWLVIDKLKRTAEEARKRDRIAAEASAAKLREAEAQRLRKEAADHELALKNAAISERNSVKSKIDSIFR
jgi:type VI protein secretion system component VasK